jgi:hypothetical protein
MMIATAALIVSVCFGHDAYFRFRMVIEISNLNQHYRFFRLKLAGKGGEVITLYTTYGYM